MDGLLLVDKPAGWTSHDVVNYVRRTLGGCKAGHTGTLDPDATGLLVVLVGRATRLARYYEDDDKRYVAEMRLGAETDTEDASGKVVRECAVPEMTEAAVLEVFGRFTGEISQTPPAYSAVKVGGRPMYKLARAGKEAVAQPRRVAIRSLRLTGIEGHVVGFEVDCSKGTYVRTLARDMAEALGSCGHMGVLRRTRSGGYTVEDALPITDKPGRQALTGRVIPMGEMLARIPAAAVSDRGATGIGHGISPAASETTGLPDGLTPGSAVRLMDGAGALVAMAEYTGDEGRPLALKLVLV